MSKTFRILNLLLIGFCPVITVTYRLVGGLALKGFTSFNFVLLGLINLTYVIASGHKDRQFPVLLTTGLILSLVADIALNVHFITGAVVFALAHVLYLAAYCALDPFQKGDLLPVGLTIVLCLILINTPLFQIREPGMKALVTVYCIVISCMLGKALGNFQRSKTPAITLLAVGSLMFWFSDLMLALELFAGGGWTADTLCLFTYFPGQAVLAHSMYHYAQSK